MIKSFLIFFIVIFPVSLFSQQRIEAPLKRAHLVAIRANLFGPLDVFDGNLTGGIEYGVSSRFSVTADAGLVLYSVYVSPNRRALGYIFKPGARYYFTDRRRGYIGGELFYKRVGYQLTDWLDRDFRNGISGYQEYRTFINRKRVFGFQLLAGYKARLNKQATFWMEPYGGISVRAKWQDIKGLPDAVYLQNDFSLDLGTEVYAVLPGIQIGLRLVIDLPPK